MFLATYLCDALDVLCVSLHEAWLLRVARHFEVRFGDIYANFSGVSAGLSWFKFSCICTAT